VAWKVGRGDRVRFGEDTWVNIAGIFLLSQYLKSWLREQGLTMLVDIGYRVLDKDGYKIGSQRRT